MKYFAYGSNLSKDNMKNLCPNAKMGKKHTLEGYRLTFRGSLPDILPEENGEVVGGLWEISESDEVKLDEFEGHYGPGHTNLYNKHYTEDGIMFYRMASSLDSQPEDHSLRDIFFKYFISRSDDLILNHILKRMINGLVDFGITKEELRKSLGLPL